MHAAVVSNIAHCMQQLMAVMQLMAVRQLVLMHVKCERSAAQTDIGNPKLVRRSEEFARGSM